MIRFQMLGTVDLSDAEGRELTAILRRPKLLALLAYLAIARPSGFHRRDGLVALLWPELDHAHARNALRQAIHSLRESLGPDVIIARGDGELAVNEKRLSSDVRAFETALAAGDAEQALEFHRGGLLNGLHVSGVPEFERWLDDEQEHIRRRAYEAARVLTDRADTAGNLTAAVRWAQRLTELSPGDEPAVRTLVALLDRAGDRAGAVRAYEAFERRLARDLELEPSTKTRSVIKLIRARRQSGPVAAAAAATPAAIRGSPGMPVSPTPRTVAGLTSPRGSRPRAWLRRGLALGGFVIVVVGGLVVAAPNASSVDPNLLAVAPFDVLDSRLELWREGLVDVLARSLDGAGPYRTVPPSVVVRRWDGRGDRNSARALGLETRAGLVVFGQLLSEGQDTARLMVVVLDTRNARTVVDIDRADHVLRIDRLADSVSADVIRALMPKNPGSHIRLYSMGTKSLPALKAFLRGEHFLRRFELDSAIAGYERAVAIDSAFAPALRRLQWAHGWNDSHTTTDYFARAAASNHGLSPRDSLLIYSDSGFQGRVSAANHPAFLRIVRRQFAVLEEAARRYPEDPDIWYQLGEARFHAGFVAGQNWNDARAAFDRAIALDSGFAPAYVHPLEAALNDNDREAALRYAEGALAISSTVPGRAAMRILAQWLQPAPVSPRSVGRELETASGATLRRLALAVAWWPDVNETQVQVWRRLLAAGAGRNGDDAGSRETSRAYATMLSRSLIHRGHLQEARARVANRVSMPFMQLAVYGTIPPDTVEHILHQWLTRPDREDVSIYPWFTDAPCSRTMEIARWWASRGDTAMLRVLAAREESSARANARSAVDNTSRNPVPGFVHAALALARADTALALNGFLAFPDSLCANARQLREARFHLLAATGRGAEAAAEFDRAQDRWVPFVLERARLGERSGDRSTAIKYYRFVTEAWAHGDPQFQPLVSEARAAIARLTVGG